MSHTAVCPAGSERPKCLMLSGFRAQAPNLPEGSVGRAPTPLIPERNGGGTQLAHGGWVCPAIWESGHFASPAFLPAAALLWPSSQDVGCHSACLPHSPLPTLLTKAGLSGAEQGRPTRRAGAPHHTLSLQKRTGLVQYRERRNSPREIPPSQAQQRVYVSGKFSALHV